MEYQKEKLDAHPLFKALTTEEEEMDPIVSILADCSEEGKKVQRAQGKVGVKDGCIVELQIDIGGN